MNRIMLAGLVLATLSAAAQARPEYDSSIDAAAARIVATKMGQLRGSFAFGVTPRMTAPVDRAATGSVGAFGIDGLKPAAELRFGITAHR